MFYKENGYFEKTKPVAQKWLERLDQVMEASLVNVVLRNEQIARQMRTSERDLFRKVKKMTGLSPQKYLRRYRFERARRLLCDGTFRTVKEVGQAVGYTNISYFILQFERAYGKRPLQVLKEYGWR